MKSFRLSLGVIFVALLASSFPGSANQGFVPVQAPKRVLRDLPMYRLDTRVLRPQVNESRTQKPITTPIISAQPDFAARTNSLVPGGVSDQNRIRPDKTWPGVSSTGWYPPDSDIAVGPNHMVQVVNSSIAWFTRAGTKEFQQTSATFFSGVATTSFIFDPKVFFDPANERYVILFLERDSTNQTSALLIAVSSNNDPNGSWYRYRVPVTLNINSQNYWLDYPGFGYSKDAYVVSGNMFGFTSGWAGVQFIAIPIAQAISGQALTAVSLLDGSGASVQMAEIADQDIVTAYGVSRSGSSALRIYAITNPASISAALYFSNVTVPSNSSPTSDAQSTNGYTLDTIDGRVFNAKFVGKKLVTTHASTPATGAPVAVRWYEVNVGLWPASGAPAPSLDQAGLVAAADRHYFMPAIAKNSNGDITLIFSASSSSIPADIMITGRKASDPAGYMGNPMNIKSSLGNAYSQGRWGDYFGVDFDPDDPSLFVGVGEFINGSNAWATEILEWRTADNNTPPNTPASLTATTLSSSSIRLSWQDTSGETGYTLERSIDGSNFTVIANLLNDVVDYQDNSLTPSTTYYYRVKASNNWGSSGYSVQASSTTQSPPPSIPSAPSQLVSGTVTRNSIPLSWSDNSNNEDGFKLERSTNGRSWTQIATYGANSTSGVSSGLKANTLYYFRVRAYNGSGNSSYSNILTAKTLR